MKLLIIDPQYDFHDVPENYLVKEHKPALAIPGAWEDSNRLAGFIERNKDNITEIFVTLDTHAIYDIGHAFYWINDKGQHPEPFTIITLEDLKNNVWHPIDPDKKNHAFKYAKAMIDNDKMPITIWPNHCIENTPGYDIVPQIQEALDNTNIPVQYIKKGEEIDSEHYGAIEAEHIINDYTDVNQKLLEKLKGQTVYIGGQALSHCLGATIQQLIKHLPKEQHKNLVLLRNTTSAVPGFEEKAEALVTYFKDNNVLIKQE